jgi:hypothetical protein
MRKRVKPLLGLAAANGSRTSVDSSNVRALRHFSARRQETNQQHDYIFQQASGVCSLEGCKNSIHQRRVVYGVTRCQPFQAAKLQKLNEGRCVDAIPMSGQQ